MPSASLVVKQDAVPESWPLSPSVTTETSGVCGARLPAFQRTACRAGVAPRARATGPLPLPPLIATGSRWLATRTVRRQVPVSSPRPSRRWSHSHRSRHPSSAGCRSNSPRVPYRRHYQGLSTESCWPSRPVARSTGQTNCPLHSRSRPCPTSSTFLEAGSFQEGARYSCCRVQ
jgi:hypothetical protein